MKSLILIISSLMIVEFCFGQLSFAQKDSANMLGKTINFPMRNAIVYKQDLFAGPGPEYEWLPSLKIISENDSVFATDKMKVSDYKNVGTIFIIHLTDDSRNTFIYSKLKQVSIKKGENIAKGSLIGLASNVQDGNYEITLMISDKHMKRFSEEKIWKLVKDE